MKRFKHFGFTTIELLIAGLLFAALGLSITQLVRTSTRAKATIDINSDFNNTYNLINTVMSTQSTCQRVFQTNSVTLNTTGTTNLSILALGAQVLAQVNKPEVGTKITAITISNPQLIGTRNISGGGTGNFYFAKMTLAGTKTITNNQVVGSGNISKSFNLSLVTETGTNIVRDCFGTTNAVGSADGASICSLISGATWNGTTCTLSIGTMTNQQLCTTFIQGATWSGGKCNLPAGAVSSPIPQSVDGNSECQKLGGRWNGVRCRLPNSKLTISCTTTRDADCYVGCPSGWAPASLSFKPYITMRWSNNSVEYGQCGYVNGNCSSRVVRGPGPMAANGATPTANFPSSCTCNVECYSL